MAGTASDDRSGMVFRGAKAKVKWANKHIEKLDALLRETVNSERYGPRVKRDPEGSGYFVELESEKVSDDVALMLGDCIHNLRAALDLLYYELVERCDGVPDKWTTFPLYNSRKAVEGALRKAKIEARSQEVVDVIFDTVKPDDGGNDALLALHKLDIADKHHLLLPVVGVIAVKDLELRMTSSSRIASNVTITVGSIRTTAGNKFRPIQTAGELEITSHGEVLLGVFFGKGQPLEGEPVFPTLPQLSQVVSGTIQAVEKALVGSG